MNGVIKMNKIVKLILDCNRQGVKLVYKSKKAPVSLIFKTKDNISVEVKYNNIKELAKEVR